MALSAPLVALPLAPTQAAYHAFLKIEGVEGESNSEQHRDEIDVLSFSWGVSNPAALTGHGGGGGEVNIDTLVVTKEVDKASPKLFLKAFTNEESPAPVVLQMTKTYPAEEGSDPLVIIFFEIELQGVRVGRVESNVRARDRDMDGDGIPDLAVRTETISLSFEEIKVTYSPKIHGQYTGIDSDAAVTVTVTNRPPEAVDSQSTETD